MTRNDPEPASAFDRGMLRLLSERMTHLINTVDALQRELDAGRST
jgi:hypothetical protein